MLSAVLTIAALIFFTAGAGHTQSPDEKDRTLSAIRQEISSFTRMLEESESKEKSVLQSSQELGHEITLHEKLLEELKRTERALSGQIVKNTAYLKDLESELTSSQKAYRDHAVRLYKQKKPHVLEFLINSRSVRRTLLLKKYSEVLERYNANSVRNIAERSRQVKQVNASLSADLRKQRVLLRDADRVSSLLRKKREKQKKLLAAVRHDKNRVQLALAEKRKAEKTLLSNMADIQEDAKGTSLPGLKDLFIKFSRMKGRLSWPAEGRIFTHAGITRDPRIKTKTVNRGIDILSTYRATVKAVCEGRVAKVTWLPWYGQTLFIQHSEGFYTVYARLSEITVQPHELITTGQIVGRVGTEITTGQPVLNFQIWKDSESLDPEDWFEASTLSGALPPIQSK